MRRALRNYFDDSTPMGGWLDWLALLLAIVVGLGVGAVVLAVLWLLNVPLPTVN